MFTSVFMGPGTSEMSIICCVSTVRTDSRSSASRAAEPDTELRLSPAPAPAPALCAPSILLAISCSILARISRLLNLVVFHIS